MDKETEMTLMQKLLLTKLLKEDCKDDKVFSHSSETKLTNSLGSHVCVSFVTGESEASCLFVRCSESSVGKWT